MGTMVAVEQFSHSGRRTMVADSTMEFDTRILGDFVLPQRFLWTRVLLGWFRMGGFFYMEWLWLW